MSYAVIFTSKLKQIDEEYDSINEELYAALTQQAGYISHESFRNEDGKGCSISYWKDLESIHQWKELSLHLYAQKQGRAKWYDAYEVKICKIERSYDWKK
jgi:heme-degrading monooxygenase HmoA